METIKSIGVKLYNLDHIMSIKYQPKKEYKYYYFLEKGHVIKKFFGLFKKTLEERKYFYTDLLGFISREKYTEIEDLQKFLKERDELRLDEETGKIYYKPRFNIILSNGDSHYCYSEDEKEAESFLEKFRIKPNFIEIEL